MKFRPRFHDVVGAAVAGKQCPGFTPLDKFALPGSGELIKRAFEGPLVDFLARVGLPDSG
jgi:hypothetical protein